MRSLVCHIRHELQFCDAGAVVLTLLSICQYAYLAVACVFSAPSAALPAASVIAIELLWQLYSRFLLLRWLDKHRLPGPSNSEWKKGAEHLVEVFSSDFRAMWEHLCDDELVNISRETALDVLHCLVPPPKDSSDMAMLDRLLDSIEKTNAPFKFPSRHMPAAKHRMVGNRDSIAPYSRHLPLFIIGVFGSLVEIINILWLLANGWRRHTCHAVPVCYWTRGGLQKNSPVTMFCPGFGNLPFCNFLISQQLSPTRPDHLMILMDLRWYSFHACAPRQPYWSDVACATERILDDFASRRKDVSLVSHSGGTILANRLVGRGSKLHSVVLMDPAVFNPPWTGASVNSYSFPVTWACGCCRSGVVWEDTPSVDAYSKCEKVAVLLSENDLLVPPRTGLHFLSKLHGRVGDKVQVVLDRGANHGFACLEPSRPAISAVLAGQGREWTEVSQILEMTPLPAGVCGHELLWNLGADGLGCVWRNLLRILPGIRPATKMPSIRQMRSIFPM